MFTASECRAIALAKLDQAKLDKRRRRSLLNAAEAWIFLATQLDRADAEDVIRRAKPGSTSAIPLAALLYRAAEASTRNGIAAAPARASRLAFGKYSPRRSG